MCNFAHMREKLSSILLILLACLYCYGGSGFYVINFCCDSCKGKGVETILAEGCHHEEETDDSCCQNNHKAEDEISQPTDYHNHCNHLNHCSIKSYKFDLNDTVYKLRCPVPVVDLSFLPLKILPDFTLCLFKENYDIEIPPLLISSRDILAKDSVLLI